MPLVRMFPLPFSLMVVSEFGIPLNYEAVQTVRNRGG
jgi:hypothetical protein